MNTTLNNRVSIYVPSTTDGNKPAKGLQKRVTKHTARVFSLAKFICKYMKQEAVTVEIDNTLYFVEA